jgi:xylulokinase
MSVLLGVDIGTTATKVSVVALDGRVRAEHSEPCTITSSGPGLAEADPHEWWRNVCALVPAVLADAAAGPGEVAAVGVSGMVPALLCLDENGQPLRPSIQQNDARASRQIDQLRKQLADVDVLHRTGSDITIQSIGPKILWLRDHEPDILARTSRICGSYDWIVAQLTGHRGVEANWALESGLWDLHAGAWATDICDAVGIDPNLLGPVGRCHEIVGTVTEVAARITGLAAGTPVSAGAADHIASAFSAGLTRDGDLLVKLGGAGDIMLSLSEPVVDPRVFLDYHLLPGAWMLNGCMAASGAVLRWFQRELAGSTPFSTLDTEAEEVPPASDGLLCLPYFLGEKSPIQDPHARGAFVGLHLGHTRAHLYRAALEAIAFGFAHHVEVFAENGLEVGRVRVTNGGSRSGLWRRIVADVLNRSLESLVDHPGSSLGSAFAAGVGVGAVDWSDIDRFARVDTVVDPDPDRHATYRDAYRLYRELYPAIAPVSHQLAARQEGDAS